VVGLDGVFHQVKETGDPWELWQSRHGIFFVKAVRRFAQFPVMTYPP
jgi:hypothetical protein